MLSLAMALLFQHGFYYWHFDTLWVFNEGFLPFDRQMPVDIQRPSSAILHSRRCCHHLVSCCDVSKKYYRCSRLGKGTPIFMIHPP
jgi:hypothetical protein